MEKLRVEYKVFVEGESTPEIEGCVRVPWPEGRTIDEAIEQALAKVCRSTKTIVKAA